jgi:hypothetical protein
MTETIDMSKIGLRPREMQVLRSARWAWTQVPNGHFLCAPNQNAFAERLIAKGFLTRAEHEFFPPVPDWIVVVITEQNYAALRKAEAESGHG